MRNKNLFRVGLGLLVIGIAFLIIPTYKGYCENNYANEYGCAGYEIFAFLIDRTQTYNGAIAAMAAVIIAIFTAIIKGINRKQLKHGHQVERAYVFARLVPKTEDLPGTFQGTPKTISVEYVEVVLDNHGKTAGYVDDVALSSRPPEQSPKPADLAVDYERSKWEMGISIPPGGTGVRVTKRFELRGVKGHVVYGRVYYRDIFGDSHTSGYIQWVMSNGTPAPYRAAPEFTTWD